MISNKKALFLIHSCIGIAALHVSGAMAQGKKVDVCHIPPGNPANAHTITISENAVDTHLDHGDRLGACDPAPTGKGQGKKVDVCHIPPGNPANAHTITISENAVDAHMNHGDHLGACGPAPTTSTPTPSASTPPPPTIETGESGYTPRRESACTCPRAGVWRVTNHEGWMECAPFGIKRKDKRKDKNDGAIWILNDDCSTIFSEAYERRREDVLMDRLDNCNFFGLTPGEEDGAKVIFDMAYTVESEEFIMGDAWLDMSSGGMQCTGHSPFQIDFLRPLSEKDYDKLKKKMEKRLEAARKVLDDNSEMLDAYLEKTNGGKAFGGMNGSE